MITLRAGFEPAREDPIGFQVQRLNHSAITANRYKWSRNGVSIPFGVHSIHVREIFTRQKYK